MNEFNNEQPFEEQEGGFDPKELFFKCLIRWPWFILSLLVCLGGAWVYLKQSTPVYNVSATVFIKDDKTGGSGNALNQMEELGFISSSQNIDNEIEVLRSKSLVKNVVTELNLYTTYYKEGTFRNEEQYLTTPVRVDLTAQEADQLKQSVAMQLSLQANGVVTVSAHIYGEDVSAHFEKLPAVWPTAAGTFSFVAVDSAYAQYAPLELQVYVSSPLSVAKGFVGSLTIKPTTKATSITTVALRTTNKRKGEAFINKLIEVYNRNANDDKNEVTRKSAEFIDERIAIINTELGSTEEELASFKQSAGLTNLSTDAQIALSGNTEYERLRVENGTQLNLVQYLSDYINNPANANDVLPVNVGLNDANLSNLITRYNEMVLERDRLLRASSDSNPVVVRLNTSIRDMKSNLLTSISSVQRGLLITKTDLDRQAVKYSNRISNAPTQERKLVGITRQQEIKAGLYLMLLQKREENAIALAATANNAKIVDDALADDAPVSPQTQRIYLIALVIGLVFPIAVIYLRELLQFKIESRRDVEKLTSVPVIGEVPLAKDVVQSIAVHENNNDMMAEVFRDIRTDLQFMLTEGKKVVLLTSTISGEGKTFTAANLAISFALLGKKVVIIGLDIRKPGLNKVFAVDRKQEGITQYLASPSTVNLMDFVRPSGVNANLFILPAGAIPPNPTELLAREALVDAVNMLKKHFDYVIIDSAPIGLMSDTKLIARTADATLYICRADYTHKSDYQLINELKAEGKLPQLCTVINGIDYTKRKYGYGYAYGYGKKYGYGYGRRYGYGYGEEKGRK